MVKSRLSSIFSLGLAIFCEYSLQRGQVYAQCSDSEALLKVSYIDPSWQGDYGKVKILVASSSPLAGSRTIEEIEKEYTSDTPFTFELCLPDDICGHLSVTGPPRELFEIVWNSQVLTEIDTGPEVIRYKNATSSTYYEIPTHVTATQFGDGCILNCVNNDEALFQFEYKNLRVDQRWMPKGYRLEDQNGVKIIAHDELESDERPLTNAGVYKKRMCLPKNECYRLFMGDFFAEDGEFVSISFDDKVLFESKAWYYESMNFGDSCRSVSSCDPNEESTVKFFMTTSADNRRSFLHWELNTSDGDTIHKGSQAADLNITLHYDEICVPKGSCITFSLGTPENGEATRYNSAMYMLSMDDVIYRRSLYYPDYSLPEDRNLDTTYLGECADTTTENSICQSEDESLVELNFQTTSGDDQSSPFASMKNFWSFSRIEESKIVATIIYANDFYLFDYEFNSSYRTIQCIPNEECLYLTVINNDYESYSVKLDGKLLETETTIAQFGDYEYEVTDLGTCGSNSLSRSAVVGIAIAGVVVTGTLAALSVWAIRQSRKGV